MMAKEFSWRGHHKLQGRGPSGKAPQFDPCGKNLSLKTNEMK
jgi:hypothetical protein